MPVPVKDGPRVNRDIRVRDVMLIDAEGANRGVTLAADAVKLAEEQGMDLVEVAPNAVPPVCKIMDYGRFRFQEQKKAAEARKKQKTVEVKEIKLRPGIDDHDYEVKMKAMRAFFEEGNKVKVTLRFRGREMAHQDLGMRGARPREDRHHAAGQGRAGAHDGRAPDDDDPRARRPEPDPLALMLRSLRSRRLEARGQGVLYYPSRRAFGPPLDEGFI